MTKRNRPEPRKLLVASIGVATISYVGMFGCSDTASSGGNLMAPNGVGTGGEQQGTGNASSGNLMSPCYLEPADCDPVVTGGTQGLGGQGGLGGLGGLGGTIK
jgi:hypothetical protein